MTPSLGGVVERFHDAFARRDLAAALACLDDSVYFVPNGHDTAPSHGDFSGHSGFRTWWEREIPRGFDLAVLEVKDLHDGTVFAEVLAGAPDGGGWLTLRQGWVYTVSAATIVAVEVFETPEAALRAR